MLSLFRRKRPLGETLEHATFSDCIDLLSGHSLSADDEALVEAKLRSLDGSFDDWLEAFRNISESPIEELAFGRAVERAVSAEELIVIFYETDQDEAELIALLAERSIALHKAWEVVGLLDEGDALRKELLKRLLKEKDR